MPIPLRKFSAERKFCKMWLADTNFSSEKNVEVEKILQLLTMTFSENFLSVEIFLEWKRALIQNDWKTANFACSAILCYILSAFYNISQRNYGILLILWCSFKLWWNVYLDLSRSKFCSLGNRSIGLTLSLPIENRLSE
jgi:hypothetical protein